MKVKSSEEEKGDRKEEEGWQDLTMPRNNILLQRLPAPKRVQLPNGKVFFAKNQRTGRDRLPESVRIGRNYL